MFFNSEKISGKETAEPRTCRHCGDEPKLIRTMLDSQKGRKIRMFKCVCGEQTWSSDRV
jgi:hypothetical protein